MGEKKWGGGGEKTFDISQKLFKIKSSKLCNYVLSTFGVQIYALSDLAKQREEKPFMLVFF